MATLDILKRTTTRPTWAEVSLENLRHNFGVIRQRVGSEVEICAVVKADATGTAPSSARGRSKKKVPHGWA